MSKKTNGSTEPLSIYLDQRHLTTQVRTEYDRQVSDDVTDEAILNPKTFGPSWQHLRAKDLIYLQNSKHLWVLRVRSVSPGLVQTMLLHKHDLPVVLDQDYGKHAVPGFKIYLDENEGWKAVREVDGRTMCSQKELSVLNSFEAVRAEVLKHATLRK
jgi:hypothetical protein